MGTQNAAGYAANSVNNAGVNVLGIGQRGDNSQFFDGGLDEAAYYTNALTFTCAPADDGTTYQVLVTNYVGSITSSVATRTVSTGLQINAPLTSITRNVGSAAAFEIIIKIMTPVRAAPLLSAGVVQ